MIAVLPLQYMDIFTASGFEGSAATFSGSGFERRTVTEETAAEEFISFKETEPLSLDEMVSESFPLGFLETVVNNREPLYVSLPFVQQRWLPPYVPSYLMPQTYSAETHFYKVDVVAEAYQQQEEYEIPDRHVMAYVPLNRVTYFFPEGMMVEYWVKLVAFSPGAETYAASPLAEFETVKYALQSHGRDDIAPKIETLSTAFPEMLRIEFHMYKNENLTLQREAS